MKRLLFVILLTIMGCCGVHVYKPQKQNAHFGKNKMPPKCDKLSSILTFQTAFKFL